MEYSVKKLCEELKLDFSGDGDLVIRRVCGIDNVRPGGLAYITGPGDLAGLPVPEGVFRSKDLGPDDLELPDESALIVPFRMKSSRHNLIFSADPLADHVRATELIHASPPPDAALIHHRASVGKKAVIGKGVVIDAGVVVYDNAVIGDRSVIRAGTVIMENATIGEDCLIYPNVVIRENCEMGNRVIVQPGTVIGGDGYGFFQRKGLNFKIPQVGKVIIEDDVEIGAGCAIDRARFDATIIGRGSKLDNLVHIAHNVKVGAHSLITGQCGIAGSVKTGSHLMMGGQSSIKDNLEIGDNVTLMARTMAASSTKDGAVLAGSPGRPVRKWRKSQALVNRLAALFDKVKKIEKKLKELSGDNHSEKNSRKSP